MQKSVARMTMTRKNLCKYIGLIYSERIRLEQSRNEPFHVNCYNFFMSHFGLKAVAESKIAQLYEAVYFFKAKCTRAKLFGRFINLFDDFSSDELDYYLQFLKKLDEDSPQVLHTIGSTQELVMCSFDRLISKRLGGDIVHHVTPTTRSPTHTYPSHIFILS